MGFRSFLEFLRMPKTNEMDEWMDHTRQSVTTTRAPVVLNSRNPPEEDVPRLLLVPFRLSLVEIAHRPTFPLAECNWLHSEVDFVLN